jgi:hypothetical protein
MLALIGSVALNHYKQIRNPNDMDLVGTYDDIINYAKSKQTDSNFGKIKSCYPIKDGKGMLVKFENKILEAEVTWENSVSEKLFELIKNDSKTKIDNNFYIPSLNLLYMLKMSHRYLKNSPYFLKTMSDIREMREMGAEIEDSHKEFLKIREKDTYNYSHPKLNQEKKDFFTENVDYRYDHDTIHLSMRHLEKPAYMYFKPEDQDVWCSREMFEKCDQETKLYAVLEETQVLALERSQVLFQNIDPKKSFDIALSKVCTSITSGWFREFSWENYNKIQKMYESDYVTKFWKDVENGLVQPLEKKKKLKY